MTRTPFAVWSLAAAWVVTASCGMTGRAGACNACREDKIAATYDWQVVSASQSRGHTVVFTAISGPVRPGDSALEETLRRTVGSVRGVDPGTVRVSLAPPAMSFACAADKSAPSSLIAGINRRLQPRHLKLSLVQVGAPAGSTRKPLALSY